MATDDDAADGRISGNYCIYERGGTLVSTEGSHHHYKHPTKKGKVTIAFHSQPKDLKSWEVKSILKQAGL